MKLPPIETVTPDVLKAILEPVIAEARRARAEFAAYRGSRDEQIIEKYSAPSAPPSWSLTKVERAQVEKALERTGTILFNHKRMGAKLARVQEWITRLQAYWDTVDPDALGPLLDGNHRIAQLLDELTQFKRGERAHGD